MEIQKTKVPGYLPDEAPTMGKLIAFAFQQILVMFPATVTVALLTGFHLSTTIFASGFATLCFLLVTRGQIPLYYGSSFSYIAAVCSITGVREIGQLAPDALISQAQFGIIFSGLISIVAGLIIKRFGMDLIERILPPTITGSIALVIGITLAGTAMTQAGAYDSAANLTSDRAWIVAGITLVSTILFSVYMKGVWGQLPILLGILVGYFACIPLDVAGSKMLPEIFSDGFFEAPHFTFPSVSWSAVFAIMPIAIATIPESTAHLFQLDLYVNDLSKKKGKREYAIADKLGLNLIGDGVGDIAASIFGGPGGTNYGENISTMAITRNFSIKMLGASSILAIIISFIKPLSNFINTIPGPVINGACIFLFGVIAAQGIAIMVNKQVDLFDSRNLAVIAVIMVVGIGGHYGFPNGMIPFMGFEFPSIATASIVGILMNLVLSFGRGGKDQSEEQVAEDINHA